MQQFNKNVTEYVKVMRANPAQRLIRVTSPKMQQYLIIQPNTMKNI